MLAFILGLVGITAGHVSIQHNNVMLPWLLLETEVRWKLDDLYEIVIKDDNGKRDTQDMALLYMLAQNGHHGSEYASHQMNSILPLLVLNKDRLQIKSNASCLISIKNSRKPFEEKWTRIETIKIAVDDDDARSNYSEWSNKAYAIYFVP